MPRRCRSVLRRPSPPASCEPPLSGRLPASAPSDRHSKRPCAARPAALSYLRHPPESGTARPSPRPPRAFPAHRFPKPTGSPCIPAIPRPASSPPHGYSPPQHRAIYPPRCPDIPRLHWPALHRDTTPLLPQCPHVRTRSDPATATASPTDTPIEPPAHPPPPGTSRMPRRCRSVLRRPSPPALCEPPLSGRLPASAPSDRHSRRPCAARPAAPSCFRHPPESGTARPNPRPPRAFPAHRFPKPTGSPCIPAIPRPASNPPHAGCPPPCRARCPRLRPSDTVRPRSPRWCRDTPRRARPSRNSPSPPFPAVPTAHPRDTLPARVPAREPPPGTNRTPPRGRCFLPSPSPPAPSGCPTTTPRPSSARSGRRSTPPCSGRPAARSGPPR